MPTLAACSAHFVSHQVHKPSNWATRLLEAGPTSRLFCIYPKEQPLTSPSRTYLPQGTFISLRGPIYCKEHLFAYKAVSREVTVAHVVRGGFLAHVAVATQHDEEDLYSLDAPRGRYMSLTLQTMSKVPSLPEKWILQPVHICFSCDGLSMTCVLRGGSLYSLACSVVLPSPSRC